MSFKDFSDLVEWSSEALPQGPRDLLMQFLQQVSAVKAAVERLPSAYANSYASIEKYVYTAQDEFVDLTDEARSTIPMGQVANVRNQAESFRQYMQDFRSGITIQAKASLSKDYSSYRDIVPGALAIGIPSRAPYTPRLILLSDTLSLGTLQWYGTGNSEVKGIFPIAVGTMSPVGVQLGEWGAGSGPINYYCGLSVTATQNGASPIPVASVKLVVYLFRYANTASAIGKIAVDVDYDAASGQVLLNEERTAQSFSLVNKSELFTAAQASITARQAFSISSLALINSALYGYSPAVSYSAEIDLGQVLADIVSNDVNQCVGILNNLLDI